jgi:membrane-associated phospholipid phosphatase
MQNMGIISLQSIAGAAGVSMVTKHVIARARPYEELGASSRSAKRSDASFPSNHAAVAFAAVTPFAQEYDAPWLYGVAALGSLGRVADRQHWVSDVVAGGVVGYAIGSWLWQAQRDDSKSRFAVMPGSKEIAVTWSGTY